MALQLMWAGLEALREYIALHVLTCLVPAFFLAGAMVTFVSKEAIVRYMGSATNRLLSYSAAAVGSFFVAACSCTVIPVASGIYFSGAGIGPAFIVLWVAPAANILALIYTGAILGSDMAVVRIGSALLMAAVVGAVMTWFFRKEEDDRAKANGAGPDGAVIGRKDLILLGLLVATLLAPNYLVQEGPFLHKVYVFLAGAAVTAAYALWVKEGEELKRWMEETWWFVKLITPLLLGGVFMVGVIGAALPQSWIQAWLGGTGVGASFVATLLGSTTYFATMTEAPFVDTLMKLGMGKGAALALLLTGPGLSLPNWLAIARVFGAKKAVVYVGTIIVLGTLVGWGAGKFIL